MPLGRLIQLIETLSRGERTIGAAAQSGEKQEQFFQQGDVLAVKGDGNLTVSLQTDGRTVTVTPTTDEPFLDGQTIWVSKTEDGIYITHGGVR